MKPLPIKTAGRGRSLGLPPKKQSEAEISWAIKRALVSVGCMVVRVQAGHFRAGGFVQGADPGTPDYCVLTPRAETIWLEIKAAKGELSDDQKRWHERARRMGHRVEVVRSVAEAVEVVR